MFAHTLKRSSFCLPLLAGLILCTNAAIAQNNSTRPGGGAASVTASASSDRVRFAAPSAVVQLRLEVYDELGKKLVDTEQRGGNVLDWHFQGGSGERVADGSYLCVVTIKSLSGRLSQRIGLVSVGAQATTVRSAGATELNAQQTQAVGPIEVGEEGLSVINSGDAQSVTVLANNAEEAQVARTRGPLTFRFGDFFSGNDKEQMRLTEAGDLGIGTSEPKAKLDVAGTIRAERVVIAKPKTTNLNSTAAQSDNGIEAASVSGSVQTLTSGSGTQNRITKWIDNVGTLTDSDVTEVSGSVGIGTTSPSAKLTVTDGANPYVGVNTDLFQLKRNTTNSGADGGVSMLFGNNSNAFRIKYGGTSDRLSFLDGGGTENLSILNGGNVGIGTPSPSARLTVTDGAAPYAGVATDMFQLKRSTTNGAADGGVSMLFGNNSNVFRIRYGGTTDRLSFLDGGGIENLSILNGGNVGIGTPSPSARLTVTDGAAPYAGVATDMLQLKRSTTNNSPTGGVSMVFGNNSNTYRIRYGGTSDRLSFLDGGGIENLSILNGGNVGIGTPSPSARLTVTDGAAPYPGVATDMFQLKRSTTNGAADGGVSMLFGNSSNVFRIRYGGTTDRLSFLDGGGTENLSILNGGNVGIGTPSPSARLTVTDGAAPYPAAATDMFQLKRSTTNNSPTGGVSMVFGNNSNAFRIRYGGTSDRLSFLDGGGTETLTLLNGGNIGIGNPSPSVKLDVAGDVNVAGNTIVSGNIAARYQDIAEWVQSRRPIAANTVVILDAGLSNAVAPSSRAYDTHVAGVISSQPGLILGQGGAGKVLVATTGRVKVKVDATRHPIKIGDLLVTSDQPGVAMRSEPLRVRGGMLHRPGTIIGKALEPLARGKGEILVLLSLQ